MKKSSISKNKVTIALYNIPMMFYVTNYTHSKEGQHG